MDVLRGPIQSIKVEACRIRSRVSYLKRIAKALADDEIMEGTNDRIELGYALHSLNSVIDTNVIFLTRLGEQITDMEHLCKDIDSIAESDEKQDITMQFITEVRTTADEVRVQRQEMTEMLTSAKEILEYFKEDARYSQ